MLLIRGNLRPIRIYDTQNAPYWELCFQGFMAIPDQEKCLLSILNAIPLNGRRLLVRLDQGMTEKSVRSFSDLYSYCIENRKTKRVFIGFDRPPDFVRFLFKAKLLFLHDITILPSDNFGKDQSRYLSDLEVFNEFPSQPMLFENCGMSLGLALPEDGLINLISADHDFCKSIMNNVTHTPNLNCHSDLPRWKPRIDTNEH